MGTPSVVAVMNAARRRASSPLRTATPRHPSLLMFVAAVNAWPGARRAASGAWGARP